MRKLVLCAIAAVMLICQATIIQAKENQPVSVVKSGTNQLIIINKETNQLAFYEDNNPVQTYPVATGRTKDLTPEGTFTITEKIKNRPYYKENIRGGDPKNPLGDRWLGISAKPAGAYGIHGNNNEKSIGAYASAGCVRLHNKDIRELFEKVKKGTPVIITSSSLSFERIALDAGYLMVELNQHITVFGKADLYSKPDRSAKAAGSISPQSVMAEKRYKNWYLIDTYAGKRWIQSDKVLVGKKAAFKKEITAFETIELYDDPTSQKKLGELTPQLLEATERLGDWYRVKTDLGEKWVYLSKVETGRITETDERIMLTANTTMYKNPYDVESIGAVSPQQVRVISQINNWYQIKSWLGDVWILVKK